MYTIEWTNIADRSFQNAIKFISKRSPINALRVKGKIDKEVLDILTNPTKHIFDSQKANNDGSFREFIYTISNLAIDYIQIKS